MHLYNSSKEKVAVITLGLLAIQFLSPFIYISRVAAQTASSSSAVSSSAQSQSSESSTSSEANSQSSESSQSSTESSATSESASASSSTAIESQSSSAQSESSSSESSQSSAPAVVLADKFVAAGPNTYVTNGVVQTGVKYVFPLSENVTIEFSRLPEVASKLTVKQIVLSTEKVAELNAASNVGYEFTTEMVDGSFEYTMTLPNPIGEKAKVIYADSVSELNVDQDIETTNSNVVSFTADHFTIFVVTSFEEVQTTPTTSYNGIWDAFGTGASITQVTSGTDGIVSSEGDNHAKVVVGAFTRWDGYKSTFPTGGYDTRVDLYLDMSLSDGSVDKRIDFSSAISNQSGNHLRDFIFHIGTNSSVAGQWIASASNNSVGWPSNPANNPVAITASGWYTLEHQFRNVADVLVVTMNLYQKGNPTPVGTWTRTNPADIISSVVGGNRYGWFIDTGAFKFDWMAIDNAEIEYNSLPVNQNNFVVEPSNWQGWTPATTVGGQVELVNTVDSINGDGVLRLTTQSDVQDRASVSRAQDVNLSSLYKLGYSTKRDTGFIDAGNASYRILIDADGNTATTTDVGYLIYEPYWQNGTSPDAAPVQTGVWQTWSVMSGSFWASIPGGNSITGLTHGAGGPPFYTLQNVLALHPNAKVIGLNIGVGSYNQNYDIQVDNVVFGYQTGSSIEINSYDFEPTEPQPPVVTIETPTPAASSYVRGIITGRATATDETGMGSYYLRFWKDAFEIAGGGTLVANCQAAPGGTGLGLSIDESCTYDTRTNPDGVYVFSAQVQDSDIMWGQALRTFNVDNTRPTIAFTNPSVVDQVATGTFTATVDATDNTVLRRVAVNVYNATNTTLIRACGSTSAVTSLGVAAYTFNCNIDTTTLADGVYTLRASSTDEAGNVQTTTATIEVDNIVPIVDIIEARTRILGGMACGLGSAWSDDGLEVNIANWEGTYQLQGRYFTNGGSFGAWFDLSTWGTLNVSGSNASIFVNHSGDAPAGAAGWEVRVVDISDINTAISNVDALNYIIETNPNTFVCNGKPQNLSWVAQATPIACGGTTSSYTVTALWDAFDSATQYEYSVTTPGIPTWTTTVGGTSYAGVFNQGAGVYTFKVRVTAPYATDFSAECAVTFDPTLAVPTLVSPANDAVVNTSVLSFDWTDVASLNGPVTYQFQSSFSETTSGTDNAFTAIAYTSAPLASSEVPSPGNPDMVAYWQARACDTVTCSSWSAPWKVNIDNTAPVITVNNDVEAGPVQSDVINVSVSDTHLDAATLGFAFSADNVCDATDTYSTMFTSAVDFIINTESNNGQYLCATAADLAGNRAYALVGTEDINIDVTAPVTSTSSSSTSTTTGGTGNGGNTNNNTNNNIGDGDAEVLAATTEGESSTSSEESGSVLGELTCSTKFNLSGFVFIDANNNKIREAGEQGANEVRLELAFRNLEGQFEVLGTVTTDQDGEWEREVCPATYRVRLLDSSLPVGTELNGDSQQLITVGAQAVAGLSFALVSQAAGFNWWPVIIVLLIALFAGGFWYYNKRQNNQA